MTETVTSEAGVAELTVWREAAELAGQVCALSGAFPAEERDWLADPICDAARSAAKRIETGWRRRRQPDAMVEHLTAAEADLHEVQTWALLAMRHHHWSAEVADGVDRRCEAILDVLADMIHYAARWCGPAMRPVQLAA